MKHVDIDLSDSETLSRALEQYLAHNVCPASSPASVGPLEDVEIHVLLPRRNSAVWPGRVIRVMGFGNYLVEVSPPPNLAWLGSLLGPEEFVGENTPMEASAELDYIEPEPDEEPEPEPEPEPGPGPELEPEEGLEAETGAGMEPGMDPDELSAPLPGTEFPGEDTPVISGSSPSVPGDEDEEVSQGDGVALQGLMDPENDGEALAESGGAIKRGFSAGVTGIESEYSDLYKRINELSVREKRLLARQGGKTARQLLIKDTNKTLHMFVIMNPKISLEEIEEYSKMPGLSAEAIRHMVKNRTWMASRSLTFNLVRNPATPVDIAVGLLPKLGTSEWRVLTNTSSIRSAIAAAARKLLFNK